MRGARARAAWLLAAALGASGCGVIGSLGQSVVTLIPGRREITQEDLRALLYAWSDSFDVIVSAAADQISSQTDEPRMRRRCLLWKVRMPPIAQQAASDDDPRAGFGEALAVAVSQRQYLTIGAGKELFGPSQEIAVTAAHETEAAIVQVGATFLPREKLELVRQRVEEFALANPIRGEFLREGVQVGLARARSGGTVDALVSIPMAPFRAIAGVESGAAAIHEFNATAQQFTAIAEDMPRRMRWELELLSYDLQERGGVLDRSLTSFQQMAASADRLALTAETLPEETRETLRALSAELAKSGQDLEKLLAEYKSALADTNATTASLAPLAETLTRVSEQVNQAGVAWGALIRDVRAPGEPRPEGEPAPRPFDVLDYEKTASSVRETAIELRQLVGDAEKLRAGVIDAALDRALRNGLILIAVFFVALLGYRVVASRIARER